MRPASPYRPITATDASSMLLVIPADDRDVWVKVGGILKDVFGDDGFSIWNEWSQRADNYNPRDAATVWRSLGRNDRRAGIGTLVFLAKKYGWCDAGGAPAASSDPRPSVTRPPVLAASPAENLRERLRAAWNAALPLSAPDAEPARAYFRHRGLGAILDDSPADVRLEIDAPYYLPPLKDGGRPRLLGRWPALLTVVRNADGRGVAIHRTYLDPVGAGKATITDPDTGRPAPARKLRTLAPGASRGAAIRLYHAAETIIVAEGIETACAARIAMPELPAWAAVSAGGIARLRVPVQVREIIVAADHDQHGAGERGALDLARRMRGSGVVVRMAMPPTVGADWADVLVASTAAGADHG